MPSEHTVDDHGWTWSHPLWRARHRGKHATVPMAPVVAQTSPDVRPAAGAVRQRGGVTLRMRAVHTSTATKAGASLRQQTVPARGALR